jgi:hypothetical protein
MNIAVDPLYYVPRTGHVKLDNAPAAVVVRGLRTLPLEVVNDPAATRYGIKPASEMTDAERSAFGLPPGPPDVSAVAAEPVMAPGGADAGVTTTDAPRPAGEVPYAPPGAAGVADPVGDDPRKAGSPTSTPEISAAAKPTVGPDTGT